MEEINSINLFGVRIDEPIVTLTDILVAALCFYYAWKLHKSGKTEKVFYFFKVYFIAMGITTTIGGLVGHAFLYQLSFYWKLPGWISYMIAILFLQAAVLEHARIVVPQRTIKTLHVLNIIVFAVFLVLNIVLLNLLYVEIYSGYGLMIVVLGIEAYLYRKTKNNTSKNILIAIFYVVVAGFIFIAKISPHQWFNHMCVGHVFMAVTTYYIYRAAINVDMSELKE